MITQIERYLKPTLIIDCDNPAIVNKTLELTNGQQDILEKARTIFYFVRDEIKYIMNGHKSLLEHFIASNTLSKKEGYCVQKAILLVAMARSVGIPSGLGFVTIRNHLLPEKVLRILGTNILSFHGYAELYLNGKWIQLAPDFDIRMCERNNFIPVEFTVGHDAILHSHTKEGKLHIEYLTDLGHFYDDLPLDKLLEARHSKS